MRASILDFPTLQALLGYERAGDVRRCLRDQGVHVFEGRNGPWTTLELVNLAGGLTKASTSTSGNDDTYPPDRVL